MFVFFFVGDCFCVQIEEEKHPDGYVFKASSNPTKATNSSAFSSSLAADASTTATDRQMEVLDLGEDDELIPLERPEQGSLCSLLSSQCSSCLICLPRMQADERNAKRHKS